EEKETGRVEAFSDGVFAIAITLLVLNLHVPAAAQVTAGLSLAAILQRQWPAFLAFTISFATILIMWTNHHKLFMQIRKIDHWFLVFNGVLLFFVTFIPYPTALLAEHIRSKGAVTAAAVYSGSYFLIAVAFNLVWRYAANGERLLKRPVDREMVRRINRDYAFGPGLYFVSFALAFVSVTLSVTACSLLACFYALPGRPQTSRA
ncbi:MAG TPA: TMEM175 family protein, partial [Chthonomonadales bacterium]|nr:TMEM175 family protein [Chthonomonadales bacterium]